MSEPMVTVCLDTDERYPEVMVSRDPGVGCRTEVQIPAALLERHEKALAEFDAVQDELYALYAQARGSAR